MRFLFFCPYGSYRVHNQVDAVLGLSLKARGHEVQIAACDGIFRDCEVLHWDPPQTKRLGCQTCRNTGREFFKIFGHSPIFASSYLNLEDGNLADEWLKSIAASDYTKVKFQDYNIGEWATSSVITCFKASVNELHRADVRALHYTYLRSSFLVLRFIERIIERHKPHKIICFNGRMYPYRVAMEVAARHGIEVLVHERGNSDDRFNFAVNTRTYDSSYVKKFTSQWMETPLKTPEIERVIEHYRARESGKDSNLPGFHTKKGAPELLRRRLNIPSDVKLTGFFTSSEFELNKFDGFTPKLSQLEVLRAVVSAFKTRTDYLVVRHHPYIIGTKENPPNSSFISELMKIADQSPPNVRVIMPQDETNTYDLLPHLSACIAPWSSVAIESAFRGVASAVLPEAHLSPAAFREIRDLAPEAVEQLLNELHLATEKCDFGIIQRCFRYAFAYIGRMDIRFKSFGIANSYEPVIRFSSAEELLPGCDPALDRIVNYLTTGSDLHPKPTESSEVDFAEECALLKAHVNTILSNRGQFSSGQQVVEPKVAILALTEPSDTLLYKQRHKNTAIYQVKCEDPSNSSLVLNQIYQTLLKVDAPFVHVAAVRARYDENFLGAAIEAIAKANTRSALCGAWLLDQEKNICAEFLSRRFTLDKPSNSEKFKEINDSVSQELLTQFIFTKEGFMDVLAECLKGNSLSSILTTSIKNTSVAFVPGPNIGLQTAPLPE